MELNLANVEVAVVELAQDPRRLNAATSAVRSFGQRRSARPLRTMRTGIGEDRPWRGVPAVTVNGA